MTNTSTVRQFASIQELSDCVGQDIGLSPWHTVTQEQINLFARATGDHQWIHVDEPRAAAGPFGRTIAHGYLTLSLLPMLMHQSFHVQAGMGINYGLNKLRFTAPVLVNSKLRARIMLKECRSIERGGAQLTLAVSVEREGNDKPVCVAETLTRFYP